MGRGSFVGAPFPGGAYYKGGGGGCTYVITRAAQMAVHHHTFLKGRASQIGILPAFTDCQINGAVRYPWEHLQRTPRALYHLVAPSTCRCFEVNGLQTWELLCQLLADGPIRNPDDNDGPDDMGRGEAVANEEEPQKNGSGKPEHAARTDHQSLRDWGGVIKRRLAHQRARVHQQERLLNRIFARIELIEEARDTATPESKDKCF